MVGPFWSTTTITTGGYMDVEFRFTDYTGRWKKLTFTNGTGIPHQYGKKNLIYNTAYPVLAGAHGRVPASGGLSVTDPFGLAQGIFGSYPIIKPNIIWVNTNDIFDPTQNTLTCEYVDPSYNLYQSFGSPKTAGTYSQYLEYQANVAPVPGPYITGLSTSSPVSAKCASGGYGSSRNVLWGLSYGFSGNIDLRVQATNGSFVVSGKSKIPQSSFYPPMAHASQAYLDISAPGYYYPDLVFYDA